MKFKNILLIDDSEFDNYINNYVVSEMEITEEITIINSAIDALDFLERQANKFPELIFLDIRMPKMDGFGFLENFLDFPEEKKEQCKIIMLSSSMDPNDVKRAKQNPHVVDYLNKPLTQETLQEALHKLDYG